MKTALPSFTQNKPLPDDAGNGSTPWPTSSCALLLCALYHDMAGLSNRVAGGEGRPAVIRVEGQE